MNNTERARAYLKKLPNAIAGQNGHRATFAAACRLVEFGLPPEAAWGIYLEWNQSHCLPPWSERDLRHKLRDAFKCTSAKAHFFQPGTAPRQKVCQYLSSNGIPRTAHPRRSLPPLRPGTDAEIARLANLRGLTREGVALASEKGLLRFGDFRGKPAWFVLDHAGRVAQARRLDGLPWMEGGKAWTVAGSQAAWPIGILEAANFAFVALVEGGPDLLAACAFLVAESRQPNCAPVAMLGGCAKIHADALSFFAGKQVRIFSHADDTGDNATSRWAEQLVESGASVDAFSLAGLRRADGASVKDLCDLAAIHPDDFESYRSLWNLFP